MSAELFPTWPLIIGYIVLVCAATGALWCLFVSSGRRERAWEKTIWGDDGEV